ncbi:MAG: cytochrome c oxidase subunit II [Armatimonadetes bacterium]|nr:cytochrome c oxidase subunit II [Armatimonadota bacterium]
MSQADNQLERVQRSGLSLGLLIWSFMIVGVISILYARDRWWFLPLASQHGAEIDRMFDIILVLTGAMFILVHALLGYFVIQYRSRGAASKAHYFPHNVVLELTYTILPGLAMLGLSVAGILLWSNIHRPPGPDAFVVEVRAEQFGWSARYPGADGVLGRTDNDVAEPYNVDRKDPASRDDVVNSEIRVVVNRPVRTLLRTRDVIHEFYVPAFRTKRYMLSGVSNETYFTPTRTGTYDIACGFVCGVGHYAMRGQIQVVTQAEFDTWVKQQKTLADAAAPRGAAR